MFSSQPLLFLSTAFSSSNREIFFLMDSVIKIRMWKKRIHRAIHPAETNWVLRRDMNRWAHVMDPALGTRAIQWPSPPPSSEWHRHLAADLGCNTTGLLGWPEASGRLHTSQGGAEELPWWRWGPAATTRPQNSLVDNSAGLSRHRFWTGLYI